MKIQRDHVLQFKVNLEGLRPPIWRRILVPSDYTFWDLHVAIQDAMGWLDYHLHLFQVRSPIEGAQAEIGIPSGDPLPGEQEPLAGWTVPVVDYFSLSSRKAVYLYDFGDGWEHTLELEEITPIDGSQELPECLAGRRRCPPEDCGGPWGYERLLEILADPSHEEHGAMVEWVGGPLDPEEFEPAAVRFADPQERWRIAFEAEPEADA